MGGSGKDSVTMRLHCDLLYAAGVLRGMLYKSRFWDASTDGLEEGQLE